jgi:hypothetical protein
MSGELDRVITQGTAQAQLRLDDGQFALRSFQRRASSVRNVQALVVYSALRRRYPVSCALSCTSVLPINSCHRPGSFKNVDLDDRPSNKNRQPWSRANLVAAVRVLSSITPAASPGGNSIPSVASCISVLSPGIRSSSTCPIISRFMISLLDTKASFTVGAAGPATWQSSAYATASASAKIIGRIRENVSMMI